MEAILIELFITIDLTIFLLFGLILILMSNGIPSWFQQINTNNSTPWNFGIFVMKTMKVIIYLARR